MKERKGSARLSAGLVCAQGAGFSGSACSGGSVCSELRWRQQLPAPSASLRLLSGSVRAAAPGRLGAPCGHPAAYCRRHRRRPEGPVRAPGLSGEVQVGSAGVSPRDASALSSVGRCCRPGPPGGTKRRSESGWRPPCPGSGSWSSCGGGRRCWSGPRWGSERKRRRRSGGGERLS